MKLNIYCLIALCFIKFSFAQSPTVISTTYHAGKKQISSLSKEATCDKDLIIKIDSVNSALYKVVIQFSDFYWYSELPEQLKPILPNFSAFDFKKNSREKDSSLQGAINYLKNASEVIEKFKEIAAKNNSADIFTASTNSLGAVSETEERLSYIIGYYEVYLEAVKAGKTVPDSTMEKLARLRYYYDDYKKNMSALILGSKVIANIAKKGIKTSFSSPVHHLTTAATAVKIYILDNFNPNDTLAKFAEDVYKRGKFSIDFSTGPGFNTLVKPQYYIGTDASGNKFIGAEDKRSMDFGVIALVHLNFKLCPSWAIGAATGISLSAIDGNTGYLIGGSISLGKQRTVSISGGAIFGKTIALSKKVSSNGTTVDQTLPTDISSAPTYEKIEQKWFFGITYNFIRKRKTD